MAGLPSPALGQRICINLVDSSHGGVIQTWQFDEPERITIGRSGEQDIRVGDQYVSRLHAELRMEDGQWCVVSHGRNGVLIEGRRVETEPLADRTLFRLGPSGPTLSFRHERVVTDTQATIAESTLLALAVHIDNEQKHREVEEIVEGSYFKELKQRARELQARS